MASPLIEAALEAIKNSAAHPNAITDIIKSAPETLAPELRQEMMQAGRDRLRTQWKQKIGSNYFNIAPEAQKKVVQFRNGTVKSLDWDAPIPNDAVVMNKKIEDLDALGLTGKNPQQTSTVDPSIWAAHQADQAAQEQAAKQAKLQDPWGAQQTPASSPPSTSVPSAGQTTAKQSAQQAADLAAAKNEAMLYGSMAVPAGLAYEYSRYRPSTGADAVTPQNDQTASATPSNQDIVELAKQYSQYRPSPGTLGNVGQNGMNSLASANFNPSAMRFSTDKAPIVQAAQKAVQQTAPAASPSQSSGIANLLSSLFQNKGGEYQSTGERLYRGDMPEKGMGPQRPTGVNFGDPDRASDFFRASKALQGLQGDQDQAPAEKRGGRVNKAHEHSAILHKALEIIHHMALKNH